MAIPPSVVRAIRQFYHSRKRQEMVRLFSEGRKDDIDLCKSCTGYYM